MVPYELTITRSGENYTFIGRLRVDGRSAGPLAPVSTAYVARAERDCLLRMCDALNRRGRPAGRDEVLAIGRFIDERVLSPRIRQTMQGMETSLLILTDDPEIPWELGGVVGDGPAATSIGERVAVGRCLMADSERTSPTTAAQHECEQPRALVIADPLGELTEAQREGTALSAKLEEIGWRVDTISGRQATYEQISRALTSGRYAVVHFCCDVEAHATGGAIPTATADSPLAAGTVRRLNLGVQIVYLNACGSAVHDRTRAAAEGLPPLIAGMAHAFIEAGALGVVGSVWKIEDRSSRVFAERFYSEVLEGASLGSALLSGKQLALDSAESHEDLLLEPGTAASFVLYGDPDIGVAAPSRDPASAPAWPSATLFDSRALALLRRAAAAANRASSALTSLHLGWSLLRDDESPLVSWMRDCGHPLGNLRAVAAAMIGISDEEAAESVATPPEPSLSPTIAGIWRWAEVSSSEGPISLEQLTERFAATPCMFREVLDWLRVDLKRYPDRRPPLPLSRELERVLESAAETARWNGGLVSSTHLLLAILETDPGPVEGILRRAGIEPAVAADSLRGELLHGNPNMAIHESRPSVNAQRILAASQEGARAAGRQEVLVHDLVDAASELKAGGFGRILQSMECWGPQGEVREGPPDAADVPPLTADANRTLDRAAQCAEACHHAVIGTPHLLAAALHDSPILRAAVGQYADPGEVLERMLAALGAPNAGVLFSQPPVRRRLPPSPNLNLALARARRTVDEGEELTATSIIISVLTQAEGKAALVLQAIGVKPNDVVRAIEAG